MEIGAEVVEYVREVAAGGGMRESEAWSLLWAGYLAGLSPMGESLTAVKVSLLGFLPPECRGVLGRLEAWVPVRVGFLPKAEGVGGWLEEAGGRLRRAAEGIMLDWTERAGGVVRRVGLPEGWQVPASGVVVLEGQPNDLLHNKLPQWLSADVRWKEDAELPVVCEVELGRFPRMRVKWKRGRLREGQGRWLLAGFGEFLEGLRRGGGGGQGRCEGNGQERAAPGRKFGEQILLRLKELEDAVLLERGEVRMTGKEIRGVCNQIRRYLRRNKILEGGKCWVCAEPGPSIALLLLAFVLEGVRFEFWARAGVDQLKLKLAEAGKEDWVFFEAELQGALEAVGVRMVPLEEMLEKAKNLSSGDMPVGGKGEGVGEWVFCGAGEGRVALDAEDFEQSLLQLKDLWQSGGGFRLLSTAVGGTPAALEEVLMAVILGGSLVFPAGDIWLTRSAFQEELEAREITHLVMPAAKWIDWVHFLKELGFALPRKLEFVLLRAGRFGRKCLRNWLELSAGRCNGYMAVSRDWLLGLGWIVPLGESLFEGVAWRMGEGDEGREFSCLSATGANLPEGFVGWLSLRGGDRLPSNDFGREGTISEKGLLGYCLGGQWFVLNLTDWGIEDRTPVRVRMLAETLLAEDETVFDAVVQEVERDAGELIAWLVPWESEGKFSARVIRNLEEGFGGVWRLTRVAVVAKYAVDSFGRVQVMQLPQPEGATVQAILSQEVEEIPAVVQPSVDAGVRQGGREELAEVGVSMTGVVEHEVVRRLRGAAGGEGSQRLGVVLYGVLPVAGVAEELVSNSSEELGVYITQHADLEEVVRYFEGKEPLDVGYFVCGGEGFQQGLGAFERLKRMEKPEWGLIVLSPVLTGPVPSKWQRKIQNWLGAMGFGGKQREVVGLLRGCDWEAVVLCPQEPSEEVMEFFPKGEFYECDLTTPADASAAILETIERMGSDEAA